jgi:anti-sigma B factor antagonist
MEIITKQLKRCDVVKATGRIDTNTAPQLAEVLRAINDAGRFKIVFDMSEVEFISSKGLGVMIDTQKTCKRWNRGQVVLVSVPKRIYSAMELAGFMPLFTFFDDTAEAVGSF